MNGTKKNSFDLVQLHLAIDTCSFLAAEKKTETLSEDVFSSSKKTWIKSVYCDLIM